MGLLSFNHFNIRASRDLLASVRDFYLDVVGLKEGFRPDLPIHGYWLYLGDLPVLHLMEWSEAPDPDDTAKGFLDHVAFSCDDLEGFLEKFEALGIDYGRRDFEFPDGGGFTQLNVSDPTGTGVELNFAH